MLLEREQIHRYMRHIIMPEIGGAGQKKLLESSIMVYCNHLSNSALMLYYLVAMGIGKIHCHTEHVVDKELLQQNLKRLNPQVEVFITDISQHHQEIQCHHFDALIVISEKNVSPDIFKQLQAVPTVLAAAAGDCGYLQTVCKKKSLDLAINELNGYYLNNEHYQTEALFNKASVNLLSTLASIEAVKILLKIGVSLENPLQFNLAALNFSYGEKPLDSFKNNYNVEHARKLLKNAKALIVGSGGLGSPAAYMLTSMGIGKLGLIDFDTVEISNLNRQILHSTDRIGMSKVKSAEEFLKGLNSEIDICTYEQRFSIENAEELIKAYDIIIDGLDNLPTRYLLNDMCYLLKKPFVEAGVLGFNGLATTIIPDIGPCYRCTFPESTDNASIPSCSETGVLGAVPGVMGIIQAVEVVKYLTGTCNPLLDKMLMFDALNLDLCVLGINKDPNCKLCSSSRTILSPQNYEFVCKSKNSNNN